MNWKLSSKQINATVRAYINKMYHWTGSTQKIRKKMVFGGLSVWTLAECEWRAWEK